MTSIIVPAYNAEKYLAATIDSVLSQSDSDWELILVDDGSADSTRAICERAAESDSRIKAIHRKNGGPSAARNTGLEHARGEYVTFLDADDILASDFLEILTDAVRKTDADFACAPFVFFKEPNPEFNRHDPKDIRVFQYQARDMTEHALYQTSLPDCNITIDHSAWGKLYKRDLFREVRFKPGIWFEDLEIFFRLWQRCSIIAVVPVPLMGYRQHSSSFIHTFTAGRKDVLDVMDSMVESIEASDSDTRDSLLSAARTRRFAAHCNIFLLLLRNGRPDRDAERRCLRVIRKERAMVVRNSKARLKDRAGALLAYLLF